MYLLKSVIYLTRFSNRIFRSYNEESSRIKRESPLNKMNTEDLMALLEMLESESRRKHPSESKYFLFLKLPEKIPQNGKIKTISVFQIWLTVWAFRV